MCFHKVSKNYLAAICAEATGHAIWIKLHKGTLKVCQVTVAMGSEKPGGTAMHAVLPGPELSSKLMLLKGEVLKLSSSRRNIFQASDHCSLFFLTETLYLLSSQHTRAQDQISQTLMGLKSCIYMGMSLKISTSKTREVKTQILSNITPSNIQILFRQHV